MYDQKNNPEKYLKNYNNTSESQRTLRARRRRIGLIQGFFRNKLIYKQ